jgi:hypothetical protein
MGKMDVICSHCGALHWKAEKLVKSPQTFPKFGTCCLSGKIQIKKLHDPPPELCDLLSDQDNISKQFCNHIQNYNNAFAMTSLGCNQDNSINRNGGGPWVFKVYGHVCHESGSLMVFPEMTPVYAQLYIYDLQEALEYCRNNGANSALDAGTMQTLQDVLYHHHEGVHLYHQAFDMIHDMGLDQCCMIALWFYEESDCRHYNLPTDTSNEIAMIIPGDGDQPTSARDIILHKQGSGLQ